MLTGKPAFVAADLAETMDLVSSSEPEWTLLPPAIPSSLDRVVRRCLAKDKALRFQRLTDVLAPIREAIGEEGAVEAFLRQSPLRRMSHVRVEPRWTTDIWPEIEKELPRLKRWAFSRLPPGYEIDVEDLVHDVAVYVARRLDYLGPAPRAAIAAFLRHAIALRIIDIRRARAGQFTAERPLDPDGDALIDPAALERYKSALELMSGRDRELILARLEQHYAYEIIAPLFSLRSADAARIAVARAVRRLTNLFHRQDQG
jgi:DNA-directed RNA polymerase specialized sigma24 family protein